METFEKSTEMPVSARHLWEWHMRPGALEDLIPPWQDVEILDRPETLEEGAELTMELALGPFSTQWVAHHRDFIEGRQFVDEQREGPFAHWVHTHRFEPVDDNRSLLHDHVEYALPLGFAGRWLGGPFARRSLRQMFDYRHRVTREAVARSRT